MTTAKRPLNFPVVALINDQEDSRMFLELMGTVEVSVDAAEDLGVVISDLRTHFGDVVTDKEANSASAQAMMTSLQSELGPHYGVVHEQFRASCGKNLFFQQAWPEGSSST